SLLPDRLGLLFGLLDDAQGQGGAGTMSDSDVEVPALAIHGFWREERPSNGLRDHCNTVVISIVGNEDAVDDLTERLRVDIARIDLGLRDNLGADVGHIETDKMIDGKGRAASLLTFEILTASADVNGTNPARAR
ncbi:MAG: hypothetical protein WA906_08405, partial [Pacificimonas sp.]